MAVSTSSFPSVLGRTTRQLGGVHQKKYRKFFSAFCDLFLSDPKKFGLHKINGVSYLVQFFLSFFLMTCKYETYKNSHLMWTLPLTGWVQALIASRTFTFLSTGTDSNAQGYYSDKRTITYSFLVENIYFSGLLLFQCSYMFTSFWQDRMPQFLEVLLVFFPYTFLRPMFPKTSLGASRNDDRQYSSNNLPFLKFSSLTSKIFYVWAKHFNGFYLNYMTWLGLIRNDDKALYLVYWLLLTGGYATTIAMFLNTMKHRKVIGPKLALGAYIGSFPIIVSLLTALQWQFREFFWVSAIVIIGVPINFTAKSKLWPMQHVYQFAVFAYLWKLHGSLEGNFAQ